MKQMQLSSYLVGVVLAEMPASFETEALKAQAVAARTFVQKAIVTGGKHRDGSVCEDSSCCQAYISNGAYLLKGGTDEGLYKVKQAVNATAGLVITYQDELIEATYYACSGGRSEDAVAVWGMDYPYLISVDSPGEEQALHFRDSIAFSPEEFQRAIGRQLPGNPENWFGTVTYTSGGGVQTMQIGAMTYTGTDLRKMLGLRSTVFSITSSQNLINVETKGNGHRVGLSQYGANAMAADGRDFREILLHYYPHTKVTEYAEE